MASKFSSVHFHIVDEVVRMKKQALSVFAVNYSKILKLKTWKKIKSSFAIFVVLLT